MTAADAATPRAHRLLRFAGGLTGLALTAGFFMSGITPPGVCGEVLRHNQAHAIDASPLFYSEVEHMPALEEGVRRMRQRAQAARNSTEQPQKTTSTESQNVD